MSDSIKVAIKVRPLIKREKDENLQVQWTVNNNTIIPIDPEKKRGETGFQFDHIFDSEKNNRHVFETVVQPIVDAAVRGFNGTVFAYGQTSSGKTYTMLGTLNEPGITPMAIDYIFDAIAETVGREFLLRVSYFEIYNEKLNDLLNTKATDLKIQDDSNGVVQVTNCKEEIVNSPETIMQLMKKGDKNRKIGDTDANERSSRSHTIFRITIESRSQDSNSNGAIQVSQLNLVDLAGSERARQTNATGERFKEGTHINMSLSSLALVIKQVSESADINKHINFRDSKLTRLLKASIGGNTMTVIICAVTPASYDETLCTLSFASRAKSVQNKPQLNEIISDAVLLNRYKKKITELHKELDKFRYENRIADVKEMESKLQEQDDKLKETGRLNQLLEERLKLLENSLISTNNTIRNHNSTKIPRSKRRRTWAGDRTMNPRISMNAKQLQTIKEDCCISPEAKSDVNENQSTIRNNKSIIQTIDLNNESFETAFADFEIDMIKVVKEREEEIYDIDCIEEKQIWKENIEFQNHVKFQDNPEIHNYNNMSFEQTLITLKDDKPEIFVEEMKTVNTSSDNQTSVLQERINYIIKEYSQLRKFTTLEKQILSDNERMNLQLQIDVSINCINELTKRLSDFEPKFLPNSLCNKVKNEDLLPKLRELEQILTKNKNSDLKKPFSLLEKELTNKYNKIVQDMDQLRNQNEKLGMENTKLKNELDAEINKLKNSNNANKSLIADIDDLMKNVLQKSNELSILKEKIIQFERKESDLIKTNAILSEDSMKTEECADKSTKSCLISDNNQDKDNEILKLKEIIEENMLVIKKYEQNEEKMKVENESLKKALDAKSEVVQVFKACQTENVIDDEDKYNSGNKSLTDKIRPLSLSVSIQKENIEQNLKDNKSEELIEDCQTNDSIKESKEISMHEEHINKLSNDTIVEYSPPESEKYMKIIEEMTNEITSLKQSLNKKTTVDFHTVDCQTEFVYDSNSKKTESNDNNELSITSSSTVRTDTIEPNESKIVKTPSSREVKINKDLVEKMTYLNNELSVKIKENQELASLIDALKSEIITKTKEMSNLKDNVEFEVQKLEKKIDVIELEKNELRAKINDISSNDLLRDFKEESEDSKILFNEAKAKNEKIDDLVKISETIPKNEVNSDFLSTTNPIDLKMNNNSPLKPSTIMASVNSANDFTSNDTSSVNNVNDSMKSSDLEPKINCHHPALTDKLNVNPPMDPDNSLKDADLSVTEQQKSVVSIKLNSSSTVADNNKQTERVNKNFELESSSIFANITYFDEMETSQSYIQNSTTLLSINDGSNNISNVSTKLNIEMVNGTPNDATPQQEDTPASFENSRSAIKAEADVTMSPCAIKNEARTGDELEKENTRLRIELEKKIRETEEVQRDIRDVQQNLLKLQQTVHMLTNENVELSKQLTGTKERNDEIVKSLQLKVDNLTNSLSTVSEEKNSLKNELAMLHEQLENVRSSAAPALTDEEVEQKIFKYTEEIRCLNEENIDLSTNLMDKIEELDKLKESELCLRDHRCSYRDSSKDLARRLKDLEERNNQLSLELIKANENSDALTETADALKERLTKARSNERESSDNSDTDNLESLKKQNAQLICAIRVFQDRISESAKESNHLTESIALPSIVNGDQSDAAKDVIGNKSSAALEQSADADSHKDSSTSEKLVESRNENVQLRPNDETSLKEMTLTSCNQCSHLKELNDCRRNLKLENHSLNQKIASLERKLKEQRAIAEALRAKVNDGLSMNRSLMDSTLNKSANDDVNLTLMEQEVQYIQNELEESKENLDRSNSPLKGKQQNDAHKDKAHQLSSSPGGNFASPVQERDSGKRKSFRIHAFKENLDKLSSDMKEIKRSNNNHMSVLTKLKKEKNEMVSEIESLKLFNEELRRERDTEKENVLKCEGKVSLLEEDVAGLYKRIEAIALEESNIKAQKLEVEARLEALLREKEELAESLHNAKEEMRTKEEDRRGLIEKYEEEIVGLKGSLQRLEDTVSQLEDKKSEVGKVTTKLEEEVQVAKSRMINELKSLMGSEGGGVNELEKVSRMRVGDIFLRFLKAIMSKEQELVKNIRDDYERSKRRLEEEIRQVVDSEKRTKSWVQSLETDLNKAQADLAMEGQLKERLQGQLRAEQESLMEMEHENQQLVLRIANLNKEYSFLNNELEKKSRMKEDRNSAMTAVQEKERMARSKEAEWEDRLQQEADKYQRQLDERDSQLASHASRIDDLTSTIEGLDAQIKHAESTISIKSNELVSSERRVEALMEEIKRKEEVNQQLRTENSDVNKYVEEIKGLLKIKCDLLAEYKTNVETMKPEYDYLQSHILEQKIYIDKCKEEIHNLKLENQKQMDLMQDKLSAEEIKSKGLSNQLNEFKNANVILHKTMEECNERCKELEREKESLSRKLRNSGKIVQLENQMELLQDENCTLKKNLEGSYNRIKELQKKNFVVHSELTDEQGKNALLEQELSAIKISLESLRDKYNNVNLQKLRAQYEVLLAEKNNIVCEIEAKRMLIANKDQMLVEKSIEVDNLKKQSSLLGKELEIIRKEKSLLERRIVELENNRTLEEKIIICNIEKDEADKAHLEEKRKMCMEYENVQKQLADMTSKNKELEDEMEELCDKIRKQDIEIGDLQDKLIVGTVNQKILDELRALEEENEKLKIDIQVKKFYWENEYSQLKSEIEWRDKKIENLKKKIEYKSKSDSPSYQEWRRSKRIEALNQNRNLDLNDDSNELCGIESPPLTPTPIIESVQKECQSLSLELASKNNKIKDLEVKLRSDSSSYQIKFNDLQEQILVLQNKNAEYKIEIERLQRILTEDSFHECHICKQKKSNKRDQSVQACIENKISLTGMSSGIVEDHLKLEKMTKERNFMKDLCRNRAKQIKKLEKCIKELEDKYMINVN